MVMGAFQRFLNIVVDPKYKTDTLAERYLKMAFILEMHSIVDLLISWLTALAYNIDTNNEKEFKCFIDDVYRYYSENNYRNILKQYGLLTDAKLLKKINEIRNSVAHGLNPNNPSFIYKEKGSIFKDETVYILFANDLFIMMKKIFKKYFDIRYHEAFKETLIESLMIIGDKELKETEFSPTDLKEAILKRLKDREDNI